MTLTSCKIRHYYNSEAADDMYLYLKPPDSPNGQIRHPFATSLFQGQSARPPPAPANRGPNANSFASVNTLSDLKKTAIPTYILRYWHRKMPKINTAKDTLYVLTHNDGQLLTLII